MKTARIGFCGVGDEWDNAQRNISETHSAVVVLEENSRYWKQAAEDIREMKTSLLAAALGRDQVPTKSANFLLRWCGIIIVALMMVIVYLLIGEHMDWIRKLH